MLICLHQQYYLISDICFHALCFKSCFFHIIILSQILAKLFPKYLASGTIKLPQQRAGCHLVLFIFRTPIGRERRNSSLPSRGDLKVARKYLMWASSGNLHVNIFFSGFVITVRFAKQTIRGASCRGAFEETFTEYPFVLFTSF
jgi:hypothetical protein